MFCLHSEDMSAVNIVYSRGPREEKAVLTRHCIKIKIKKKINYNDKQLGYLHPFNETRDEERLLHHKLGVVVHRLVH